VTFSTGAQSLPEQHSLGYQEWALAGEHRKAVAARNKMAAGRLDVMGCRAGS
jgi:hypothetical protein